MILNSKVYDVLKRFGRIYLPALSALYVALAAIWGLPLSQEIAGTIAAVVAALNAVLEAWSAAFKESKESEANK